MNESRPLPKDEEVDVHREPDPLKDAERTHGGLRLVVRKLQLPVRPRGVLAE